MIYKVFKIGKHIFIKKVRFSKRFSKAKSLELAAKQKQIPIHLARELQIRTDTFIHSLTHLLSVKTKQAKLTS